MPTLSLGRRLEGALGGLHLSFRKLVPGQPLGWGVRTCLGDPPGPLGPQCGPVRIGGPYRGRRGRGPNRPAQGGLPASHTYRLLLLLRQRERGTEGHARLGVQGAHRNGRVGAARRADGWLRAAGQPSAGGRAGPGPPAQRAPTQSPVCRLRKAGPEVLALQLGRPLTSANFLCVNGETSCYSILRGHARPASCFP